MRTYLSILALAALTIGCGGAAGSDDDGYVIKMKDGSRDPFSYAAKIPEGRIIVDPGPLPASDITEARQKLDVLLPQAESALLEGDPARALRDSDVGLAAVQGLRADDRALFSQQWEALLRISKAAQRSLERIASENEFKRLNIAVTGLLIRDGQPQAIVNAKLLSPGDFVAVSNADDAPMVLVREIRKNEIVVRFRGYLMTVDIKTDPVR